jgi:hypothetical protein
VLRFIDPALAMKYKAIHFFLCNRSGLKPNPFYLVPALKRGVRNRKKLIFIG